MIISSSKMCWELFLKLILITSVIHLNVVIMVTALFQAILISALFDGSYIVTVSKRHRNHSSVDLFPISIIHINDFHARFEETNEAAVRCRPNEKCIGGYARAVTVIKELQRVRINPIYLNAGDNFQGTFWYTVGGWEVTSYFLNMLNADAITLGNHEFDRGIAGVVPFIEHLKSPIVIANIDDSEEPTFQGKYRKSIIIERYNRKIGIIGVIISSVNEIATTENLRFYNESDTIRREAMLLKEQGANIIIVLSHCGLAVDYKIARETAPFIDVIVGGHTHSFMYYTENDEEAPGPDKHKIVDTYPAVVETQNGHKVLIVQASSRLKYVGDLTVYFTEDGRVAKWEGNPIYLDSYINQDSDVLTAIQPWKETIDAKGMQVVGHAESLMLKAPCEWEECILGNFFADALVYHYKTTLCGKQSNPCTEPIIGLVNSGSLRANINAGQILYSDLAATMPFGNSLDIFELRGDHLKEAFERAVKDEIKEMKFVVQVSGIKVVYNMTRESLNRVVSIEIIERNNSSTVSHVPINPNEYYHCISSSYMTKGGDAFDMIPKYMRNHRKGMMDIDVMMEYLEAHPIINATLEKRIEFLNNQMDQ